MEPQESDALGWAGFVAVAAIVCVGILSGSLSCEHHRPHPPTKGQGAGEANMPTVSIPLSGPAEQGRKLFDSSGCRNCHAVHGRGGTIGPNLSDEGARGRSPAWLRRQIRDPKANDLRSVMFPFDYLSDQQVNDLVAYLESLSLAGTEAAAPSAPGPPVSPGVTLGKQVFDSVGCLGCHMVNGQGGKAGPDLSNIANAGYSRQWFQTQIRDPKAHDPQTAMPAFNNLSDQQVNDLVDYLETLSTASKAAPVSGPPRGRQLFDTIGCRECHTVDGKGGQVGPDLSDEGHRGRSRQWLETQIRNPRAHDPNTAMPAWDNLPGRQVDDLVDYLESLKTGATQGGSVAGKQGSP
jgi:sulfur oxidation c-type cytochrome SoxX